MKKFLFLSLLMLAGCASDPKPIVMRMPHDVPGTTLTTEGIESVRYSENIKAYNIGRYVDPNNGLMMHEAHPIYRVETTAKWNLHPNGPAPLAHGPAVGIRDAAHKDSPTTPEIVAEVNKQKAATQAVIEQGERLDQALSKLSTAVNESRHAGEQNQQLKEDLDLTKQRLDALEAELRKKQDENSAAQTRNQETQSW